MRIYHRNASALLFERVHSLSESHNSWRSIHLNLAGKREQMNQTLRLYFVVKGLVETLRDHDGYIYLCNDGDIFILFQGALRPTLLKLAKYFGDIDVAHIQEKNKNGFFNVYDLSREWEEFLNLCFAKSLASELLDEPPAYMPEGAEDMLTSIMHE